MPSNNLHKYLIAGSVLSWILLLASDLYLVSDSASAHLLYISDKSIIFIQCIFYLCLFLSFRETTRLKGSTNFNDNLWQVFLTGAATILFSLFIKFVLNRLRYTEWGENPYLFNTLYQLNSTLIAVYLANAFYSWKKMILFQRSKRTEYAWNAFELMVLISILSNFYHIKLEDPIFYLWTSPLTFLGFALSFNLKWVAFMNYKQKWNSILLVVLTFLISVTFIQQIFEYHDNSIIMVNMLDLSDDVFVLAMFAFIVLYCFTSFLVLVFHLPTSSVFEQKFGEVMIFQRLSQSIQEGQKEEEVYEILIQSSIDTVVADAAWLEIIDEKGNYKAFLSRNIDEFDIFEIKKVLRKNHISINNDPQYIKNMKELGYAERIQEQSYRSFLLIPLFSHNQQLGTLALLKNDLDGFDKEMVDTIFSFVSQASMAIKNFRLITEAIEHERYKEEIKIARDVQKSLLPEDLMVNIDVEMNAYSKGAEEVGGDYYDLYRYNDKRFAVVIGDVSGHGTSAAFNMAQMKGIFQSLSQLNLDSRTFMVHANQAISQCLEKKSFITLSFFQIDTDKKEVHFSRAGHCPTLLYKARTGKAEYMQSKGLGLGIIRNGDYSKHIESSSFTYESGDMMVLYTDGVVEAANAQGDEFGYEKLAEVVQTKAALSGRQLIDFITEEVITFCGTRSLHDDYTLLVVRFM